jgi:hypothetical protein
MYAMQAKNIEAERRACEIRLRAERKAGALTGELARAQGKRTDRDTSSKAATKSDLLKHAGISKDQASRWERLAKIPDEEFEAALRGEGKPSTNGIITDTAPPGRR